MPRKPAGLPPAKVKLIHVARRRLGMEEEDYRLLLIRAAGVDSASKLSLAGFHAVMEEFVRLGFTSDRTARNFGRRPGMATPGQVDSIRRLWAEFTGGTGTDATLGEWLNRTWRISALRFLPAELAPRVIIALRAMCARRPPTAPKVA
jgi:hypothetical protein